MKFSNNGTFKPRLKTMNLDQMKAIHEAALKILDATGFEMQHEDVRRMLLDAGCSSLDGGRLSMPEKLVEKALETAPEQILLHDQTGKPVMDIQGENCFYGTGSDTIFTIDLDTGERRRTMIQDTANFAKMVDALDNMDFAMSMSNPEDVPIGNIYGHVFLEMVKNTNKPLIFIADSGRDMAQIHQIACLVAGGEEELAKKPFILNYSEAISPLIFPVNVMEKLVFCAEKQIPICLPSGCNAGGGGPITLAGAMALGIAENLVGLVVHQLTRPGSPFLFAPNVSILDMQTSVISYGCPEWSLTQAALAQMRDELYHIPIWAFAGSSDSKTLDAQAGAEAMFSISTAMHSRCNIIHDVGYMEFGTTSSLELLVLCNELVAMSRHFTEGVPVNEETLALDVIDRVAKGSGASSIFLTEDHTFENFRQAHFLQDLIDRRRFDQWDDDGAKDMYQRCNQRAKELLASHHVKAKSPGLVQDMEDVLDITPRRMAG
jgi:trimethylamine--corrinoid protein Co-methyltransferase